MNRKLTRRAIVAATLAASLAAGMASATLAATSPRERAAWRPVVVVTSTGQSLDRAADRLASGDILVLRDTPGGSARGLQRVQAMARRIIIDGRCASACLWLLIASPKACYTMRASFVAHAWHSWGFHNVDLTSRWLARVRWSAIGALSGVLATSRPVAVPSGVIHRAYPDRFCGF